MQHWCIAEIFLTSLLDDVTLQLAGDSRRSELAPLKCFASRALCGGRHQSALRFSGPTMFVA
jgi:hypothetical protein